MRKHVHYEDRSFSLGLSTQLAMMLYEAHDALYGFAAKGTKDRNWQCIRKLARCLSDLELAHEIQFPAPVLCLFFDWLESTNVSTSSKQSDLKVIHSIIQWCDRNIPNSIGGKLAVELRNFERGEPKSLPVISEEESREIMRCALDEIDEIVQRIREGRRQAAARDNPRGALLAKLLEIGTGKIPHQLVVNRSGENLARRVRDEGGLKSIVRHIFPTPRDVLPFYVAIQFQLAGNPQAVSQLQRRCIESNSLRDDREWVVWSKLRSSRVQRADFPIAKATAAPSLIRLLLELNEPLVEFAGEQKDSLFLAYDRGRVTVPSLQTWHNVLSEFRQKHSLSQFSFVQLRRTSAVLHHKAASSIIVAKQKLNHASVSTTIRYSGYDTLQEHHEKNIQSHQQEFHASVVRQPVALRDIPVQHQVDYPADTVFGFQCSNPFGGFQKVVDADSPCDHFYRCATCPGALVPLDKVEVVAALIKSRDSLQDARERATKEGWLQRFNALYQPTLQAIVTDLLPYVPSHILKRATEMSTSRPFPALE